MKIFGVRQSMISCSLLHTMLVGLSEFKKALVKASIFTHKNKTATLKRIFKFAKGSAAVNTRQFETSMVAYSLSLTGLTKRAQEIKFFYKLVSLVKPVTFLENLEESWALRSARKAGSKKKRNIKIIPSPCSFKETIRQLHARKKYDIVWALLVMAGSGRRFADVARIDYENIKQLGKYKYICSVEFDKMNNNPLKFRIDFEAIPPSWRPASLDKIDYFFRLIICHRGSPCKDLMRNNLARQIKTFHPHGLRSLLAIYLTSLDVNDQKIMRIIGWRDSRSLMLYRRLGRDEIAGKRVEDCVKKANLGFS